MFLERVFDCRKKRVTDLDENSRVHLPKPLPPSEEATIEMRRAIYLETFNKHKNEFCNKRGEQVSNLDEDEEKGLKMLKKRIKNGELIVMKTDKSNKFAVTSVDNYLKMGQAQIKNDKEINRQEICEREKILNGHSKMWCKMLSIGENFNHQDRVMESKTTRSNNLASMYLLLKDHKEKLGERVVVSGCNYNTRGLSNMVSEFLES